MTPTARHTTRTVRRSTRAGALFALWFTLCFATPAAWAQDARPVETVETDATTHVDQGLAPRGTLPTRSATRPSSRELDAGALDATNARDRDANVDAPDTDTDVVHAIIAPGPDAGLRAGADAGVAGAVEHRPGSADLGLSRTDLVRAILGVLAIVALAMAAGHPAVRSFERRAGLAMVAATGMPFLLLGAVARMPSVGILSDAVMEDLRPLLEFGLGWIGFRVGSEFDVRSLDRLSRGVGRLVAMESFAAFTATSLGAVAAIKSVSPSMGNSEVLRDALVLGACAAVSAPSGARALETAGVLDERASRLVRKIAVLDDVVPIMVLALVASVFRANTEGSWVLPRLGWVFVQVGMGAALGTLTLALIRAVRNEAEEIAVTFGAVAFAAGMAGYLHFSPLTVGCIAGVVVVNVEGGRRAAKFAETLQDLERPIYMVFFAIAGALWDIREWRGWVIVLPFVLARMLGKLGGARAAFLAERNETAHARAAEAAVAAVAGSAMEPGLRTSWLPVSDLPDAQTLGIALIPTSAVAVAVIISAQQSYPRQGGPELETVVIVGAIISEIVFQLRVPSVMRKHPATNPADESPTPPEPRSTPPTFRSPE